MEERATAKLPPSHCFIAENAWQELEVWLLAGHDLPKEWQWQEIRAERDPKELYFMPLAKKRGLWHTTGQGRKTLGLEAAKRYPRIRQLCDEVAQLEQRIRECLAL